MSSILLSKNYMGPVLSCMSLFFVAAFAMLFFILNDTDHQDYRILASLFALGIFYFFLIFFLAYKIRELEKLNRKYQETYELSNTQIVAIEASSDGIGIMDAEKRLLYMNKALQNLHGIADEDAADYIGKDWKELYNDKGKAHIEGNVYPILNSLGEWQGESRIRRKDNEIIDAELTLTLLPDHKSMIGTARDVTHRRQAERENRELQSQIHQAQKMEAVGRLAGGVAHDFNNILAAILGYAEFLSEDLSKNKKLKEFADNIMMAGHKGKALVDQMLEFSRRKESQISVVNLSEVISETVSMVSAGLSKSIQIQTNIYHDKPAYINGDASQISQALMNIVVNAVDAMEYEKGDIIISLFLVDPDEETYEGMMIDEYAPKSDMPPIRIQEIAPSHINLELSSLKRHQSYFQISITDSGTGMPETVMQHIFEPFFTTKAVNKGTGLGMANVHGVVVAHQGAMIIDSVLMEGTTFDLFLPQAQYIDDVSLLSDADQETRLVDFSGIRILLIDDRPDVLNMMQTLLGRSGFECVAMPSAIEALDYLKEASDAIDLVITDQNMPKMTGVEMVEQCAADYPALPFIIISGYSHEKLQEIRVNLPAIKATLRKPAKKETLLRAIERVLKETLH